MRGAKKPSTELENLAAGLGNAEDPYLIKELLLRKVSELADEVRSEIRYSAISMLRAGRYFMAIKKKLGHGKWEDFVYEQKWNWNYVRAAMKLLEVVAKFPQVTHLPSGRTTDRLLNLPMPKIEAVMEDLPPEAVKKLTPWDLERIYKRQKLEDAKSRPKKPLTPEQEKRLQEVNERYQKDKLDKPWMEVNSLWAAAVGTIGRLADAAEKIEMEEHHYDEVFKRDMLAPISREFDRLVHKWRPIEEIQKRATVMQRPSFAAKR